MDPGVAALIGALVGGVSSLLAGFFGPWLKEALSRKTQQRESLRTQLRVEIASVVEAYGSLFRARQREGRIGLDPATAHILAATAAARVGLLLDQSESEVDKVMGRALNSIMFQDTAKGAIALSCMQRVVLEWYRGEIPAQSVSDQYFAAVAAMEQQSED